MDKLIDLQRYPLDRPTTDAYQALVARCQADLEQDGLFNLPGFLRPGVAADAVDALAPKWPQAFTHSRDHNIYFKREVPGLPPDHPALRRFTTINHTLTADQLGEGPVLELYEAPALAQFLAAVMGMPALYPMADPLARANVMAYHAGEALNWHFDRSEFTTTLLLQAPEQGGDFEFAQDLRSPDHPNYDGVADLLAGRHPTRIMPLAPGTLNVFRGRNTAHRVTPVQGDRARIIAVFSYFDRPGVTMSAAEQRGFYGRAG